MDLQGRIKVITPIQSFGANGFQKREVVIVTEEQYPQTISFEVHQGNCELLNNFQVGQIVKITFDIRGREWTNPQGEVKYFNSLVGWRIVSAEVVSAQPSASAVPPPMAPITPGSNFTPQPQGTGDDLEDDLPF